LSTYLFGKISDEGSKDVDPRTEPRERRGERKGKNQTAAVRLGISKGRVPDPSLGQRVTGGEQKKGKGTSILSLLGGKSALQGV